ncbi:thiamine biosynthesis protein ThiS [Pedobacter yulinensis]|uniref:Thiamine biosynthesis protein ThiS n=1 Tax=Pedobacter yulinensis TaxID=2126353 RepID=A0A2T3HKS7_9SPHI|nr:sulfur carrier protein ThiS [Pedobacter yulinensis]PST83052.1 thiamine biosynthesis protein ThiS [Pedobacter yulinensis]
MIITLNNNSLEIAPGTSLEAVVAMYSGQETLGIAVAVNELVITRQQHAAYQLKPGDQVLIVKATQGG